MRLINEAASSNIFGAPVCLYVLDRAISDWSKLEAYRIYLDHYACVKDVKTKTSFIQKMVLIMPTWADIAKKPVPVEPVLVKPEAVKPVPVPVKRKTIPVGKKKTWEQLEWEKYDKHFFLDFALRY